MKKQLLIAVFSLLACISSRAANDAVFVWVDGTTTCYQLTSYPKVTFEGTKAILTLQGESTPVLQLDLVGNAELKVTFGEYDPSGINTPETPVTKNGKFIRGGRLIIVKDGRLYTIDGKLVD